jgi:hypothetical protein
MFNEDFQLHKDEVVIITVRRHWLFLLIDILQVVFLFIIPTSFIWFAQYFSLVPEFIIFGITFYSLTDILIYMWAIICWLYLAEKFTDFAIDYWVVTNKRIVDSNLEKLFKRRVSTLELRDIEDITIKTSGFFSSYFAYGNLEVQTAGAANRFEMETIAHPEIVQRLIFEAKLAQDREEKDIEKSEIEQISERVVHDFHIPKDQKVKEQIFPKTETINVENEEYDWAKITDKQEEDVRNIDEKLEIIEAKYKTDIDEALRTE